MKIVIAGGGLSGWISAYLMSKKYPDHEFLVIDSSKNSTIGVGEGTTGYFVQKLLVNNTDFTPKEFFNETKATPKLGIIFNDWSNLGEAFYSPIDGSFTKDHHIDTSVYYDYANNRNSSFGESSVSGCCRAKGVIPFYRGFDDDTKIDWYDIAVHLDNELTIKFLKKHSLKKKNVTCIDTSILSVKENKDGVEYLICEDQNIDGDLFLDCTGFKRLLSKKHGWNSYQKYLPTNSVITFQMSHDNKDIDCVTQANAMNHGWSWVIPTQERYGAGYVYCDYFTSEDEATKEILKKYPDVSLGKSFKFDAGKQKKCWHNNVISLGLSYQFLEPLQATSIHFTLVQLDLIDRYCIKPTKVFTLDNRSREIFNGHVDRVIENFKDFVNLHYSGKRTDTKFWKLLSKQHHLSNFTKEIIRSFRTRGLFYWDFTNEYGTTGQELWIYTLLGLNHISVDDCYKILTASGTLSDAAQLFHEKSHPKHYYSKFLDYDLFMNRLNN